MFHPLDATAMILGWNLGTALLFMGIAALFSRRLAGRSGMGFPKSWLRMSRIEFYS
jgi:hypothetical protein